mgnify:FL=1
MRKKTKAFYLGPAASRVASVKFRDVLTNNGLEIKEPAASERFRLLRPTHHFKIQRDSELGSLPRLTPCRHPPKGHRVLLLLWGA